MPKAVTAKTKKTRSTSSGQAVEKTAAVKTGGLTVDVLDIKGAVVGTLTLPKEVFGAEVNKALLAQAVRVYRANQRQGTASTKTRGEVQGSTRKIYRQKGTGRARHGGVRAPIFVHGGIAHGPKPQDHSLTLPQKMRQAAMRSALSARVHANGVRVIDGVASMTGKTKEAALLVKACTNGKNKKMLFVVADTAENFIRGVRNIEGVAYTSVKQLNTYDVLNYTQVFLMKDVVSILEKTYSKEA